MKFRSSEYQKMALITESQPTDAVRERLTGLIKVDSFGLQSQVLPLNDMLVQLAVVVQAAEGLWPANSLDSELPVQFNRGASADVLSLDDVKKWVFYGKPELADKTLKVTPVTGDDTIVHMPPSYEGLTSGDLRVVHAVLGLVTEASEMARALMSFIDAVRLSATQNNPAEFIESARAAMKSNLREELGDNQWYGVGILADELGETVESIHSKNNYKLLKKRYSVAGFNADQAANRDTASEVAHMDDAAEQMQTVKAGDTLYVFGEHPVSVYQVHEQHFSHSNRNEVYITVRDNKGDVLMFLGKELEAYVTTVNENGVRELRPLISRSKI